MRDTVERIDNAERAEVRTRAGLAAEVVAPYWPIRTFISRNPLSGFQHLPFEEGVRVGGARTGGRGYAAAATYRDWYREGRIRDADLDAALRERLPVAAERLTLSDGGVLEALSVLRQQMLLDGQPMTPLALAAELDEDGLPWRLDPALPTWQREALLAGAPSETAAAQALWRAVRELAARSGTQNGARAQSGAPGQGLIEQDLAELGASGTLADWCDRLLGSEIRPAMLGRLIHWVAAFVDQGQAVWGMPKRERDLYQAWRYLGRWDLAPAPPGARWRRAAARAPEQPEDAIILALRALGIPRHDWQHYLAAHIARQPGWAGLIRWRANNPGDYWQRRHPISPTKYLAIALQLEAAAVDAVCRRRLGIPGNLEAIRARFVERPQEYLVRRSLAEDWLPPSLERRVRRALAGRPTHVAWARLAADLKAARERLGGGRTGAAIWPLFRFLQGLGWDAERVRAEGSARVARLHGWLAALPAEEHGPIWLSALERGYRVGLLAEMAEAYRQSGPGGALDPHAAAPEGTATAQLTTATRPLAQALFCIDVRSEPFRRALENLGGYETFGVAGFFGVPFSFVGFNSHYQADLCPVLLKPNHRVVELPRPSAQRVDQHLTGSRVGDTLRHTLHDVKGHVLAPFVMVEAIGWAFGLPFVLKTLVPRWYHRLAAGVQRWVKPPVPTALTVDKLSEADARELVAARQRARISLALRREYNLRRRVVVSPETLEELRQAALAGAAGSAGAPRTRIAADLGLDAAGEAALLETLRRDAGIDTKSADRLLERVTRTGFTDEEQAYFVEGALRLIGLTAGFARLVLIAGHGSHSENNPYESALDCGACGGDHGDQSARVLAHMANKPSVREALAERGIAIPHDCWFIAGEHDTTTDAVRLLDLESLPLSHRRELEQLRADLAEAGARCARERCRRLPDAPNTRDPRVAVEHVAVRGLDWSQVRPEWGLANNAAFIIARRAVIRRLNLGGRAFLHSYDYRGDEQGRALETIMTAPLVVAHWINMEYYFSAVDNAVYGAGSKVYHNVVGLVGVMSGNQSDLRIGLPSQTVAAGGQLYHEPMRLLAVVEAPPERIGAIVARNAVLRQMFDNEWARLAAIDPASGRPLLYDHGRWRDVGEGPSSASPGPAKPSAAGAQGRPLTHA